jgi:paraquat-inducible protein B
LPLEGALSPIKGECMGKTANKTLIGIFVIGAVALVVIAVVVFGSSRLFSNSFINVMYFEGSVKGLNVGSPVMLRGVKVGFVKKIELRYDARDLTSFIIPVYVEIDPSRMVYIGHKPGTQHTEELIKSGLRAVLEMQSMVTGQLVINLDLFPDKPAKLYGIDKDYPEIPTIPSGLEELLKTAQQMPLKELMNKIMLSIEGIEKIVSSPKVSSSLNTLDVSLKELSAILVKIDSQAGPVMTNLKDVSLSVKEIARKGEGLPEQLDKTLVVAQDALKQAEKALHSIQGFTSDNSTLSQEANVTLREVSGAARSIRILVDYLQQHPESLIQGKQSK